MTDERDEIRSRIDIVDLIGREIQLKKAGKTWKGLCPFHPDKNPSLTVSSETGRYKCWSCGEAGDAFTWVMKRQNVDFVEALQTLATMAGITLSSQKSGIPPTVRLQHQSAMEEALSFFRDQLLKNASAKEYCERRGLATEVLSTWEVGYGPDVGEALAVHLKKKGLPLSECKALFLVDEDSRGGFYDRFRGRLMFPIRDEKGALVAFGGRLLGDGHPKYINSSDTPLYRKSRVLYGMNRARDHISKSRQAVLVEGYLDVIACHRAGVQTALASLGTALSEEHAKLLKRWCEEVVILYDSDDAGQKAAQRAIHVLRDEGLKVRLALMPKGEDPDTLLRTRGPAAVVESVDAAVTPIDFYLQALRSRLDPEQDEFWSEAVSILAQATSEPELDRHLAHVAPFYPWQRNPSEAAKTVKKQVLAARRKLVKGAPAERPHVLVEHHALKGGLSSAEIVLLRACLDEKFRPLAWRFACEGDLFATRLGRQLTEAMLLAFTEGAPAGKSAEWLHRVEPEELRESLSDLMQDFRAENLTEERLADSVQWLKDQREQRLLEEMRRAGGDRMEIFKRLKLRKPDPRTSAKEEDTLF